MPAADPACVRSGSNDKNEYRPRNPEDSLLYRTIAAHLETFLARQQERGREVSHFVEREMRAYLSCGVMACGFLRLQCESCGKDRLLPLSCKGRSVCPSCCGRRVSGCERKPDRAQQSRDGRHSGAPCRSCVSSRARPAVGSLPPVRFALSLGLRFDNDNCRLAGLHPVLIWLLPPVGARLRYRPDPVWRGHFRAEVWVGRESSCPFPRTRNYVASDIVQTMLSRGLCLQH